MLATRRRAFKLRGITNVGLLAAAMVLAEVGCGTSTAPPSIPLITAAAPGLKVVATTTLLADLTRNVGGDLVRVSSIVPPGADVHAFQTTPSQSVAIGEAQVLISNGLGLDDFLGPVLNSAKMPGAIQVVVSDGLNLAPQKESLNVRQKIPGQLEHYQGDEHGSADPHLWLDPLLGINYVERIREALASADPDNAPSYAENAAEYTRRLRDLNHEITQTLAEVPSGRRHLVTFHDAYGHFGRRYGWQVSAFVPTDASDVTPGDVKRVLNRVRSAKLPAVFVEPQFQPDVLTEAARDAGVRVAIIRSLPDDDLPNYVDMMRSNAQALAENLR